MKLRHEKLQFDKLAEIKQTVLNGGDPYPTVVEIHPTDNCNQNCRYCFHRRKELRTELGRPKITLERYQSLLEELSSLKIGQVSISGGGEPFCDRRTVHLLGLMRNLGISARIVSNGSILSDQAAIELLSASEVRFSIDAVREETYSSLRGVDKKMLEQVLKNIRKLINLRNETNSALLVGVTFLVNQINKEELPDFIDCMLRTISVDQVVVKHDVYSKHKVSPSTIRKLRQKISPGDSKQVGFRDPIKMELNGLGCVVPYFKIALNPYGDVLSCCLRSQPGEKNGLVIGNIKQDSFKSVWEKSRQVRNTLLNEGASCKYCNHTDYLLNLQWKEISKMKEAI